MSNLGSRFRLALLAAFALGMVPSFALAQDRVPTREGNIWGGMDHEPVPSEVQRQEETTGIHQSPAQQDKTNNDVESLYRQLMGKEGTR